VRVVEQDLRKPLRDSGGRFDAIFSCYAIHHPEDERRRELYEGVFGLLKPDGVF
jgi:cyclopropane fatty-acyl-phospholipid synthase-like methyltransferase